LEAAMPLLSFVTKYFEASSFADDDSPIWRFWVSDGDHAALVNPASGRMHAYVWHDGYGKYYPTIILPVWRALPLILKQESYVISLLPFPRLGLEFFRIKSDSIVLAQEFVEYVLAGRDDW
jgi:hypothetical protein